MKSQWHALAVAFTFALHARAQDPLTNGLVAFYPFNGTASDASGNGNYGAVIGYDWKYASDRFGQSNSLYLNTTSAPSSSLDGAYVIVPRNTALDFNSDFTITLWLNTPAGLGTYVHNLVSNGPDQPIGTTPSGANLRLNCEASAGGKDVLQFVCNHTNGDIQVIVDPIRQSWWHAAVVRSGTNLALFRNGGRLTNAVMLTTITNSSSIWLGRHICPGYPGPTCPSSYPLIGGLDEVRLYNRALTASEVHQLYQHEVNPLPFLEIAIKTMRVSMFLEVGTTNQLDRTFGLGAWTPYGSPFTATNSIMYEDVEVLGTQQQFFRVRRIIP